MALREDRLKGRIDALLNSVAPEARAEIRIKADRQADLDARYAVVKVEVQRVIARAKAEAARKAAKDANLARLSFLVPQNQKKVFRDAVIALAKSQGIVLGAPKKG